MTEFSQLGLSLPLQQALQELGYENPTQIQKEAIPLLRSNHANFIGLAQTGTGKTASFGLPLLDHIRPEEGYTQALILAPTRELVQQILKELSKFSKYLPEVKMLAVYGGVSIMGQKDALKKPVHIIVATPGRLIDLMERKMVKLHNVDTVVLDEADEMLNMGFKEDLDTILAQTPENKATWLFSATMPQEIRAIISKYMKDPLEVSVNTKVPTNVNISHQYIVLRPSEKYEALKRIVDSNPDFNGLVFCRTKNDTKQLAEDLSNEGMNSEALHGDLSQAQRDEAMRRFRSKNLKLLIATDVAARGLDVDNLSHVIHYSLPDDIENYTHRSGRTARAGKKGISVSLITRSDVSKVKMLEKKLKINFERVTPPTIQELLNGKVAQWTDKIVQTPVNAFIDEELMNKAYQAFNEMSKEELVNKLLTLELEKMGNFDENFDRNVIERTERPDKAERLSRTSGKADRYGDRFEKNLSDNMTRFFINMGTMDNLNKGTLLKFICDVTKLKKQNIGHINLQKRHAFFEVEKKVASSVPTSFKNQTLNGRALRVNKDEPNRQNSRNDW